MATSIPAMRRGPGRGIPRGARPGLTLLELAVAVIVAGALLALALPRLGAIRDAGAVRAALDEMAAALSTARHAAIARGSPVAVVFDPERGRIEVRSDGRTLLRRSLGAVYGIVLGANRDSVVYDVRGLGYGVSNLTVTAQRGTSVDTLTVSRLGRVRW